MAQTGRLARGFWYALACADASAMEWMAYPARRWGARLGMHLERGEARTSRYWFTGAYLYGTDRPSGEGILICIGLCEHIRYGTDGLSGGAFGYAIGYAPGKGRGERGLELVCRGISYGTDRPPGEGILVCIGQRWRIRYGMDSLSGGVGYAIGYACGKGRGESKPVLVYRGISLMGQIGRLTRGCWMALACAGASAMERIAYPAGRSGARLDMRLERGEGKASGIRLCGFA